MALTRIIDGKRFLFRSRHRLMAAAQKAATSLRRRGRDARILTIDGLYHVYATSMFDQNPLFLKGLPPSFATEVKRHYIRFKSMPWLKVEKIEERLYRMRDKLSRTPEDRGMREWIAAQLHAIEALAMEQNPLRQYANKTEIGELIDLYHLARVAGKETRYQRMIWATDKFVREHPAWEGHKTSAYLELERALEHSIIGSDLNPLRQFCCRTCGTCAPSELLAHGKLEERFAWLRSHYKFQHPVEFQRSIQKGVLARQRR